ncbi:MAG: DUF5678 domain-containing protein [Candidatus Doudnabacteria bacterium]|nr:DUF5678 domain-containing protein [Candidatus Doudnabacteria bacterium]
MAIDLTKIYQKYKGLWVALKEDKITVVAAGKTVKEVLNEANTKGFNDPILFKVPTRIIPQIGAI